jgi:hypothetical protein
LTGRHSRQALPARSPQSVALPLWTNSGRASAWQGTARQHASALRVYGIGTQQPKTEWPVVKSPVVPTSFRPSTSTVTVRGGAGAVRVSPRQAPRSSMLTVTVGWASASSRHANDAHRQSGRGSVHARRAPAPLVSVLATCRRPLPSRTRLRCRRSRRAVDRTPPARGGNEECAAFCTKNPDLSLLLWTEAVA